LGEAGGKRRNLEELVAAHAAEQDVEPPEVT